MGGGQGAVGSFTQLQQSLCFRTSNSYRPCRIEMGQRKASYTLGDDGRQGRWRRRETTRRVVRCRTIASGAGSSNFKFPVATADTL